VTAIDVIGLVAAILTTASFLPQAVMVLQTRKTDGISLAMYLLFTSGVAVWLSYGILIGSAPVIIANAITLVLAACILSMKVQAVRAQRRHRAYGVAQGATLATSAPIAS